MLIKKILFPFLAILFIFSCSNPKTEKKIDDVIEIEPEIVKKDTIEPETPQWIKDYIMDGNVTEKLLVYGKDNLENKITIFTNYGKMKFRLYNETPLHRANFVMLSKKKIFNNTMFYRVIKNFMIQGGNSDDDEITEKMRKIGSYTIPNEIKTKFPHKYGAIAMAVTHENQKRDKSSSCLNFYIVKGRKLSEAYLDDFDLTETNKKKYLKVGGAAHLDGNYTVFGELVSGFSVLSKISRVKTNNRNWPKKRIIIDSIVSYK